MTQSKTEKAIEALERLYEIVREDFGLVAEADDIAMRDYETILKALRATPGSRLDPDMPTQELRLHMGELSADEMRVARAAIAWANSVNATPVTAQAGENFGVFDTICAACGKTLGLVAPINNEGFIKKPALPLCSECDEVALTQAQGAENNYEASGPVYGEIRDEPSGQEKGVGERPSGLATPHQEEIEGLDEAIQEMPGAWPNFQRVGKWWNKHQVVIREAMNVARRYPRLSAAPKPPQAGEAR
jgi:hypothetical protein